MKFAKSLSLRSLWELRLVQGLEPVLEEINRRLLNGDFDIREWRAIRNRTSSDEGQKFIFPKSEEFSKPISVQKEYSDWSPASIFGQDDAKEADKVSQTMATKEELFEIAKNKDWSPTIVSRIDQLVRMGMENWRDVQYEIAKEFGERYKSYGKDTNILVGRVKNLIKQDEDLQRQAAKQTRDHAIKNYAAECFQKLWRVYRWKIKLPTAPIITLRTAAITIEATIRMWQAYMRFKMIKQKNKQLEYVKVSQASLKIMSAWRKCQNRRLRKKLLKEKIRQQNLAIVVLQRCWRRFVLCQSKKIKCALVLQSLFRMRRTRREWESFLVHIKRIQSFMRKALSRHHSTAVCIIQRFLRWKVIENKYRKLLNGFTALQRLCRRTFWMDELRKASRVIRIQRCFRNLVQKKKWTMLVLQTKTDVILIQATSRAWLHRKKFIKAKAMVIRIQATWRAYTQKKRFQGLKLKLISIQLWWCFQHHKLTEIYVKEATRIQKIWKKFVARKKIMQRRLDILVLKKERKKLAEKQKDFAARLIQIQFRKCYRKQKQDAVPESENFQTIIEAVDELVSGLKQRKNGYIPERIKLTRKESRSKFIPIVPDANMQRGRNREQWLPPISLNETKKANYRKTKKDMREDARIENNYKWSYKNQMKRIEPSPPQDLRTNNDSSYLKRKKYESLEKLHTKPMGERRPWSNHFTKHNQKNLPKLYRRVHANIL